MLPVNNRGKGPIITTTSLVALVIEPVYDSDITANPINIRIKPIKISNVGIKILFKETGSSKSIFVSSLHKRHSPVV